MADRRVSGIRIGVLIAGVTAGSLLLTAVPQGQQQTQGRGRAGQVQTPQVPTVGVPQIKVPTINFTAAPVTVTKGDRIAQGILLPSPRVEWDEVGELRAGSRGGFGATGK